MPHPYPWKIRRSVANNFDDFGIVLNSVQERLNTTHVPEAQRSCQLGFDFNRSLPDICERYALEEKGVI